LHPFFATLGLTMTAFSSRFGQLPKRAPQTKRCMLVRSAASEMEAICLAKSYSKPDRQLAETFFRTPLLVRLSQKRRFAFWLR
jgi:hypothetical protein